MPTPIDEDGWDKNGPLIDRLRKLTFASPKEFNTACQTLVYNQMKQGEVNLSSQPGPDGQINMPQCLSVCAWYQHGCPFKIRARQQPDGSWRFQAAVYLHSTHDLAATPPPFRVRNEDDTDSDEESVSELEAAAAREKFTGYVWHDRNYNRNSFANAKRARDLSKQRAREQAAAAKDKREKALEDAANAKKRNARTSVAKTSIGKFGLNSTDTSGDELWRRNDQKLLKDFPQDPLAVDLPQIGTQFEGPDEFIAACHELSDDNGYWALRVSSNCSNEIELRCRHIRAGRIDVGECTGDNFRIRAVPVPGTQRWVVNRRIFMHDFGIASMPCQSYDDRPSLPVKKTVKHTKTVVVTSDTTPSSHIHSSTTLQEPESSQIRSAATLTKPAQAIGRAAVQPNKDILASIAAVMPPSGIGSKAAQASTTYTTTQTVKETTTTVQQPASKPFFVPARPPVSPPKNSHRTSTQAMAKDDPTHIVAKVARKSIVEQPSRKQSAHPAKNDAESQGIIHTAKQVTPLRATPVRQMLVPPSETAVDTVSDSDDDIRFVIPRDKSQSVSRRLADSLPPVEKERYQSSKSSVNGDDSDDDRPILPRRSSLNASKKRKFRISEEADENRNGTTQSLASVLSSSRKSNSHSPTASLHRPGGVSATDSNVFDITKVLEAQVTGPRASTTPQRKSTPNYGNTSSQSPKKKLKVQKNQQQAEQTRKRATEEGAQPVAWQFMIDFLNGLSDGLGDDTAKIVYNCGFSDIERIARVDPDHWRAFVTRNLKDRVTEINQFLLVDCIDKWRERRAR